jgi:hypothetical protein
MKLGAGNAPCTLASFFMVHMNHSEASTLKRLPCSKSFSFGSAAKKIGEMATDKGRNSAGYVVMFVLLWFGGEILGAIFGLILSKGELFPVAYIFALVGAAVGAGTGFMIVGSLPALEDEDIYPRRRRRRRREREEAEEDRPRRRRLRPEDETENDSYRERFKPRRIERRDELSDDEDVETRYRRRRRQEDE